jgi:small subunit ribosomal protein S17
MAGNDQDRGSGRTLVGVVTSDKMTKTVVVTVTRRVRHRLYQKYIVHRAKYKAHDERQEYKRGDVVQIVEARPMSREKRWRVQKLVRRPEMA